MRILKLLLLLGLVALPLTYGKPVIHHEVRSQMKCGMVGPGVAGCVVAQDDIFHVEWVKY